MLGKKMVMNWVFAVPDIFKWYEVVILVPLKEKHE
jgi:hypothetical protein